MDISEPRILQTTFSLDFHVDARVYWYLQFEGVVSTKILLSMFMNLKVKQ